MFVFQVLGRIWVQFGLRIYSCLVRAILAKVPHDNTHLTIDGRLSPEKVIKKDPAMKEILNVGATYTFVPRRIFLQYPGLDEIAQMSGNYIQNASKAEHDAQMLLKIAGKIDKNESWDVIKDSIMKSRPKDVAALPGMFHFLRKFGGGMGMKLAKQSLYHMRAETNTARKVGNDVWDALGADFRGTANQLTMLRHGIMLLLYTDSNPKVAGPGDVKNLMGSKDMASKAVDAETFLVEMRDALDTGSAAFNTPEVAAAYCKFQVTVVAWLLNKKNSDALRSLTREFNIEVDNLKLGHLKWYFIQNISDVTQAQVGDNSFKEFELQKRSVESGEPSKSTGEVRDSTKDMTTDILNDAGWKVNDLTHHKDTNNEHWKITAIKDGLVHLTRIMRMDEPEHDAPVDDTKTVHMIEFQSKVWKQLKIVASVVVPQDAPMPETTAEYQQNLIKSIAFLALNETLAKQEGADMCQVRLKPTKCVVVTDNIAKGKLQLVPQTHKLTILDKSKCSAGCETYSNASLFLGSLQIQQKQYCMFAAGMQSSQPKDKHPGMQAPFWAVETTSNESEANCVLSQNLQNCKIAASKVDAWMQSKCTTSDFMKVPTIVSSKALNKGDKLKLFVPSKRQKKQ